LLMVEIGNERAFAEVAFDGLNDLVIDQCR
jgi:hypothetical protein